MKNALAVILLLIAVVAPMTAMSPIDALVDMLLRANRFTIHEDGSLELEFQRLIVASENIHPVHGALAIVRPDAFSYSSTQIQVQAGTGFVSVPNVKDGSENQWRGAWIRATVVPQPDDRTIVIVFGNNAQSNIAAQRLIPIRVRGTILYDRLGGISEESLTEYLADELDNYVESL